LNDLLAGDLVLFNNTLWEIIDDVLEDGDTAGLGVTLENGHWMRNGRILSYGVRGYMRRDYHQITPDEIESAWRLDRTVLTAFEKAKNA